MAFCSSCGSSLLEGVAFCSSCGARVGAPDGMDTLPYQMPAGNMVNAQAIARQQSMDEMKRTLDYFMVKKVQYDELDATSARIDVLKRYNPAGLLVWGILFGIPAVGLIIAGLCCFLAQWPLAWAIFGPGLGCAPFSAMFISIYVGLTTKYKKELVSRIERYNELVVELDEYYKAFGYCVVGEEYSNPSILLKIYDVIRAGRADSAKEAINVLLDDAHKTQMELNSLIAASAANKAAKSAGVAAGFAAASFFF